MIKCLLLSVFLAFVILAGPGPRHAAAQPPNNSSAAFCVGLAPGYYCQPADALHVVQCPGGALTSCPNGTFCDFVGQVGPVPSLQCAPPITLNYCKYNVTNSPNSGKYCISGPGVTYNGYMDCSSGKLTRCNYGTFCAEGIPGQAFCMPVPPVVNTTVISTQPPLSCTGVTVINSTTNCLYGTQNVTSTTIPITASGFTAVIASNSTSYAPCYVTTSAGVCVHYASQCTLNSVQICSTSVSVNATTSSVPVSMEGSVIRSFPTLTRSVRTLGLSYLRSICSRLSEFPNMAGDVADMCPKETVTVVSYVTRTVRH